MDNIKIYKLKLAGFNILGYNDKYALIKDKQSNDYLFNFDDNKLIRFSENFEVEKAELIDNFIIAHGYDLYGHKKQYCDYVCTYKDISTNLVRLLGLIHASIVIDYVSMPDTEVIISKFYQPSGLEIYYIATKYGRIHKLNLNNLRIYYHFELEKREDGLYLKCYKNRGYILMKFNDNLEANLVED